MTQLSGEFYEFYGRYRTWQHDDTCQMSDVEIYDQVAQ